MNFPQTISHWWPFWISLNLFSTKTKKNNFIFRKSNPKNQVYINTLKNLQKWENRLFCWFSIENSLQIFREFPIVTIRPTNHGTQIWHVQEKMEGYSVKDVLFSVRECAEFEIISVSYVLDTLTRNGISRLLALNNLFLKNQCSGER